MRRRRTLSCLDRGVGWGWAGTLQSPLSATRQRHAIALWCYAWRRPEARAPLRNCVRPFNYRHTEATWRSGYAAVCKDATPPPTCSQAIAERPISSAFLRIREDRRPSPSQPVPEVWVPIRVPIPFTPAAWPCLPPAASRRPAPPRRPYSRLAAARLLNAISIARSMGACAMFLTPVARASRVVAAIALEQIKCVQEWLRARRGGTARMRSKSERPSGAQITTSPSSVTDRTGRARIASATAASCLLHSRPPREKARTRSPLRRQMNRKPHDDPPRQGAAARNSQRRATAGISLYEISASAC